MIGATPIQAACSQKANAAQAAAPITTASTVGPTAPGAYTADDEAIRELAREAQANYQNLFRNMRMSNALEALWELVRSQSAIFTLTGRFPVALSYPNGNSSARTRKIASWFYTYGVRTCAGVYETGSDPLLIERITVSRDTTLDEFKRELEIP